MLKKPEGMTARARAEKTIVKQSNRAKSAGSRRRTDFSADLHAPGMRRPAAAFRRGISSLHGSDAYHPPARRHRVRALVRCCCDDAPHRSSKRQRRFCWAACIAASRRRNCCKRTANFPMRGAHAAALAGAAAAARAARGASAGGNASRSGPAVRAAERALF